MGFFLNRRRQKEEKRQSERFEYWFNIKIRLDGNKETVIPGYCKNVSEGGMLFITTEILPVTGICFIQIELPDKDFKLEVKGVILRSEKHSERNFFETAVTFVGIDENKAQLLNRIRTLYMKNE